jgi:hypothetical protein
MTTSTPVLTDDAQVLGQAEAQGPVQAQPSVAEARAGPLAVRAPAS